MLEKSLPQKFCSVKIAPTQYAPIITNIILYQYNYSDIYHDHYIDIIIVAVLVSAHT